MLAAVLREEKTKAETIKALMCAVTASQAATPAKAVEMLSTLIDGIEAMYVPAAINDVTRSKKAREAKEAQDLELLKQVSNF